MYTVGLCTRLHWTSHFLQGTRNTRPYMTVQPIYQRCFHITCKWSSANSHVCIHYSNTIPQKGSVCSQENESELALKKILHILTWLIDLCLLLYLWFWPCFRPVWWICILRTCLPFQRREINQITFSIRSLLQSTLEKGVKLEKDKYSVCLYSNTNKNSIMWRGKDFYHSLFEMLCPEPKLFKWEKR